jgi:hypothetical protein
VVSPNGAAAVPRASSGPTAHWLTDEGDEITASTQVLGNVALTPRWVGDFIVLSRLLQLSGPAVEAYLGRSLIGAVAEAIDTASLGGSGVAGEPLGIANDPNVTSTSGGTLAWSHILAAEEVARDGGANNLSWVLSPDAAEIAAARARLTNGSIPILPPIRQLPYKIICKNNQIRFFRFHHTMFSRLDGFFIPTILKYFFCRGLGVVILGMIRVRSSRSEKRTW